MTAEDMSAAGFALDQVLRARDIDGIETARARLLSIVESGQARAGASPQAAQQALEATRAEIDRRIFEAGLFVFADGRVRDLTTGDLVAASEAIAFGDGANTAAAKLRSALVRMGYPRSALADHSDRIAEIAAKAAQARSPSSGPDKPPNQPPETAPPPEARPAPEPEPARRSASRDVPPAVIDHATVAGIMAAHPGITSRNEMIRALRTDLAHMGIDTALMESRLDDVKGWAREELQRRAAEPKVTWNDVNPILTAYPEISDDARMGEIVQDRLSARGFSPTAIAAASSSIRIWVESHLSQPRRPGEAPLTPAQAVPSQGNEKDADRAAPPQTPGVSAEPSGTSPAQPPARPDAQPTIEERRQHRSAIQAAMAEVLNDIPDGGLGDAEGKLRQKLVHRGWDPAAIERARDEIAAVAMDAFKTRREKLARDAKDAAMARPANGSGPRKATRAKRSGGSGTAGFAVTVIFLGVFGGGVAWWLTAPDPRPTDNSSAGIASPSASPEASTDPAQERTLALKFAVRNGLWFNETLRKLAPEACSFRVAQGTSRWTGHKLIDASSIDRAKKLLEQGILTDTYIRGGQPRPDTLVTEFREDASNGAWMVVLTHSRIGIGAGLHVGHYFRPQIETLARSAPRDAQGRIGSLYSTFSNQYGETFTVRSGLRVDDRGLLTIQEAEYRDTWRPLNSFNFSGTITHTASVRIGPAWSRQALSGSHETSVFGVALLEDALAQVAPAMETGRCRISSDESREYEDILTQYQMRG
ncbi:hypothetical protein [Oceanicola sp. S124]|uniref:hypothetical protein n=1 Tax=Oceanicola sp. S124 TaxID=1042378 RepID=UPI000255942B|nr:hypothetical protein [Oceanicola sp. S124]